MIWAIALGGALGAVARWGTSLWLARWTRDSLWAGYPLGTLTVNVIGAFLLGWLVFHERLPLSPLLRVGIGTGFLGALTTFSTFELELWLLHEQRGLLVAGLYLLASVGLGFAGLVLGRALATTS